MTRVPHGSLAGGASGHGGGPGVPFQVRVIRRTSAYSFVPPRVDYLCLAFLERGECS